MRLFARVIIIAGAVLLASCSHGGSSGGENDSENSAPAIATEKAVDSSGNEISIETSGSARIITSGTQATYTFTLNEMSMGPYAVTFTGTAQNASDAHIYMLINGSKKASVCPFDWSASQKSYSFILLVPDSYNGESVSFNIEVPAGTTQIDDLKIVNQWYLEDDGTWHWNMWTNSWRENAYIKDFSQTANGVSGTFRIPYDVDPNIWGGISPRISSEGIYAVSFEVVSGKADFTGVAYIVRKDGTQQWPQFFSTRTVSKGKYFGIFPVLPDFVNAEYQTKFGTVGDNEITIKNLKIEPYNGQTFEGTELFCYTIYEYGKNGEWDINISNIKDSSALPVIKSYTENSITVVLPKDFEEDAACMEVYYSVKFPISTSTDFSRTVEAMVSGPADAPARMYNIAWYDNGYAIVREDENIALLQTEPKKIMYSKDIYSPQSWEDSNGNITTASMTGYGGFRFGFWKAGTYTISSPKGYRTEDNTSAF